MAFDTALLFAETNAPPGRRKYRYDTTDHPDLVEAAGYMNNKDDNQNLQRGDRIDVYLWSATPFAAGSLVTGGLPMIVTNVIGDDAAASAGAVNMAQVFLTTSLFSSGT